MTRLPLVLVCVLAFTLGCGDSGGSRQLSASIVYTEFGVPHITADSWAGLGFGQGYAYAQENFCVLMREIVASNGQAARYFGEDRAADDFVLTWLNEEEAFEEYVGGLSDNARALYQGYAEGFNMVLEERGVDGLPEGDAGCRGAEWVRPITESDLVKRSRKLILASGTSAFAGLIIAASDAAPTASMASAQTLGPQSVALDLSEIEFAKHRFGSNAYAVGTAGSQTGRGILLGNPHFPWAGPERFFVKHLTIPGEYDVFGGSLHGAPFVMIGFNKDLAWSHTTSTSPRFSFYELELLEDDPFRYRFDDEVREIEAVPVTIEVMLEDGTIEEQTKNIYLSHYGPILDLAAFNGLVGGWPTLAGTAFTYRDANIDNARFADQFVQMGQSSSIGELEEALANIGLPWVNTTAADRNGDGFYGDITTAANIPEEKLNDCAEGLAGLVASFGFPALNGSRSACAWDNDPGAPEGLFSFENLPKLRTSDEVPYVGNANDSYWLANPNQPLEGFSPVMGGERTQRSLRTRQLFVQGEERLAGTDGLSETPGFTVDLMREIMYGNRNLGA
ncbi:MAG: penicillin acylase family protein, partial [Myxococcota bacterium]